MSVYMLLPIAVTPSMPGARAPHPVLSGFPAAHPQIRVTRGVSVLLHRRKLLAKRVLFLVPL